MATDDLNAPLGQSANKEAPRFRTAGRASAGDRRRARPVRRRLRAAGRWSSTIRSAANRCGHCDRPEFQTGTGHAGGRLGRRSRAGRAQRRRTRRRAAIAASARGQHQDRHHHRRLDRQAPGGRDRRTSRDSRARRSIRACSKRRATAPIPSIAPDGARPADAYARAVSAPQGQAGRTARSPSCVGGLGISASATAARAVESCPAP